MTKAKLEALYKINNGGSISANDCIDINRALATTKPEDIPSDQVENVKDYLIYALNIKSVDKSIEKDLESLLAKIQASEGT